MSKTFIVSATDKCSKSNGLRETVKVQASTEELARQEWCILNFIPTGYRNDGICEARQVLSKEQAQHHARFGSV